MGQRDGAEMAAPCLHSLGHVRSLCTCARPEACPSGCSSRTNRKAFFTERCSMCLSQLSLLNPGVETSQALSLRLLQFRGAQECKPPWPPEPGVQGQPLGSSCKTRAADACKAPLWDPLVPWSRQRGNVKLVSAGWRVRMMLAEREKKKI